MDGKSERSHGVLPILEMDPGYQAIKPKFILLYREKLCFTLLLPTRIGIVKII